MKFIGIMLVFLAVMAVSVAAQNVEDELGSPGITPDSPFYGLDKVFDFFQSAESVANERAAEAIAMARENKQEALNKALEGYEKAMARREAAAERGEDAAASVAQQAAKHLEVLARVRDQVPEAARQGIDNAISRSSQGFDRSLASLQRHNPERANEVAQSVLQGLLDRVPEAAQKGIQTALEAMQRRGKPESAGANGAAPDTAGQQANGGKPADAGRPANAGR